MSDRKLKPLPPDPFRHQDSAIAPGSTIVSTNAQCVVTDTSCVSPALCSAGSSTCLYPQVTFNPGSGNLTGNLQVIPSLVSIDRSAQVYWNVSNVTACTVTGSNGDSWGGSVSPSSGETTSAITKQTVYMLSCTADDGTPVS